MKLDTLLQKFILERFLDAEGILTDDTADFTFGFGRSVCPGEYLRSRCRSAARKHARRRRVDTLPMHPSGVLW